MRQGVCSNFLCRARPGQEVTLTGPSGKIMLLPEAAPDADVIMVGTGTGIAPYRGFLRRLFEEDTPAGRCVYRAGRVGGVGAVEGRCVSACVSMDVELFIRNSLVGTGMSGTSANVCYRMELVSTSRELLAVVEARRATAVHTQLSLN